MEKLLDLRVSNGWWNADKGLPLPKGKCWLDADATLREAEHSLDAGAAVRSSSVAFLEAFVSMQSWTTRLEECCTH